MFIYYISQHNLAKKQQQSDNEIASLDLTESDVNAILTSDDWESTKETKISVLSNVEAELMAMLTFVD